VVVDLDWKGGLWSPVDGGLESFNSGFLVLPNRARQNSNLTNSWVEIGLYLGEGPEGK
jgi:hypothetical protein